MRDVRDNPEPRRSTPAQEAFEGRFESVPVERVLRSVPTAVVHVHSRGQVGRVVLAAGRPVHAELGQVRGPEAVYRLVGAGGSFRVESASSVDVEEPTIECSLDELLIEATRRAHRRVALAERLPPPDKPLVAGSGDVDGLNRVELELLARCDGKRTRDEILLWWRDELAAMTSMVRLWEAGGIEIEPSVASSSPTLAPPSRSQAFLPTLEVAQRQQRTHHRPVVVAAALVVVGATAGGLAWVFHAHPEDVQPMAVLDLFEPPVANSEAAGPPAASCPEGMTWVNDGEFTMGTDAPQDVLASSRPTRRVEVEPFCIDVHEVTVAEYQRCVDSGSCEQPSRASFWPRGAESLEEWERAKRIYGQLCNGSAPDRAQHPVNCVTWSQAASYCGSLAKALPTGEQWEAAARGPDGRRFPWGDSDPTLATGNFCGHECRRWKEQRGLPGGETMYPERDGYAGTAPVGSFPEGASPYGALDMAGNVFEWTAEQVRSREGAPAYVIRGGAFNGFRPEFAAAALRFPQDPAAHTHGIGFRCVSPPVSR